MFFKQNTTRLFSIEPFCLISTITCPSGCRPEVWQGRRRARRGLGRRVGRQVRPLQVDQRHNEQASAAHRALPRQTLQ